MYSFSPENRLVLAACSPSPDIAQLRQAISEIDNWEKAGDKLIKKGVAPLFLEILQQYPELTGVLPPDNDTDKYQAPGSNVFNTPRDETFTEGNVLNTPGDTSLTKGNVFNTPGNATLTTGAQIIPPEVVAMLRQTYLKTVTRSMILYDAFREIAGKFNERGVNAVALKGIYLAERLYPKIGMRQFSDIDLLVSREEVDTVLEIMEELGFRMTDPAFGEAVAGVFESAHLRPLVRKGVSVEVHTRLHGPTQAYLLPEREMAQRAVPTTINGQPFRVFELHDLLIHLCLHLDKHFNGSHMQMYSWADIAHLLKQRGHELDGALLRSRCAQYGAEKVVLKVLEMSKALFGAPLPDKTTKAFSMQRADDKAALHEAQMPDKTTKAFSMQRADDKAALHEAPLTDEKRISPALIEQLTRHLDDRMSHESGTQTHLFFIRRIKSPLGKLNYLREVLLPGKKLMLRSYKIKNERLFWMWYPYRIWVGLKGFFWKNK